MILFDMRLLLINGEKSQTHHSYSLYGYRLRQIKRKGWYDILLMEQRQPLQMADLATGSSPNDAVTHCCSLNDSFKSATTCVAEEVNIFLGETILQ